MITSTVRRVPDHSSDCANERIQKQTRANIARLAGAAPKEVDRRLAELEREWDVERVLETNALIAILTTLTMGATVDRRWFAASAVIAGFLLQHAVQGWCPPLPVLRRLGFRTSYEIDEERYALKALRGDFDLERPKAGEHEIEALERFEDEGGFAYEEPPVANRDHVDMLLQAVRS